MRTKNKSIKVCLFDVSLHAPATSFKIVTCKDVVDWFDKTETVGVPVVGLSFPMAKIVDPGKFAPVVKKGGCGKLASFKLGMLCFVDDYVYLIGDGTDKDSYSIDIRRVLGLKNEVIPIDVSDLWGALDAEISDDGKKIYFFRAPHSDWYDELKSIKNNQYFEYSLETGVVNVFFAPVNDSRDFIESIHEKDGKRIILVSKTDKSGKKLPNISWDFLRWFFLTISW